MVSIVPLRRAALSLVLAVLTLTVACAGKEGAAGPMGPQGPQGPPGPGATKLVITATGTYSSSSGSYGASVTLPSAVGTDPTRPPALDCYMSDNPSSGIWLTVGGGTTGAYDTSCGAVFTSGAWHAVMIQMPGAGWTAAFVVAY